ncbi:DNA helicase DnaB-like protein [Rhizobium phage RHph_TM16]|nr:DNA helicase DnaB-like protein [Rhizobium phage RHph_TM16]
MATLGHQFLAACLTSGSTYDFLNHGEISHLFRINEKPAYEYVKEYVKKYGKLPSEGTVELHTKEELPAAPDATGYYFEEMVKRHTQQELNLTFQEASKFLQPGGNLDPHKALEITTAKVMELVTHKFGKQIVDFRDAYQMVWGDYVQQMTDDGNNRLFTGWPYLDDLSGGLAKGDTLAFVGRPAMGKTWQLLYLLMHGWKDKLAEDGEILEQGQSRLLFSMEMKPLPIAQRLTSMKLSMPYSDIDKGNLSNYGQKKLKEGLTEISGAGAPFWIVDGNLSATIEDMVMIARQLKPDAIGIDGAYLAKHPTIKDRYQRVAENADLIKQELAEIAPVAATWQFARDKNKGGKKGEPQKKDLEDIGYSDAIGQVSSLVCGIMQKESVETVIQRVIDILKGRKGETGQFTTNWDFNKMDFSEYEEPTVEELNFS